MDRIIVLGRDMADVVARKLDGERDRITNIPNWGDWEVINPQPREGNPMLANLGISDDKLVVQYAGNMGLTHDIETLANAAEDLRESNVHWLFLGSGAKRPWLEREAQRRGLSMITVTGLRPRSELETALAACDVSIISFMPGMAGVSVPSRMYNVMASARPIIAIADPESEIAHVLLEEEIGWVVPPGEPAHLVALLRSLIDRRDEVRLRGLRAREVVMRKYGLSNTLDGYELLVRELGALGDQAEDAVVAAPEHEPAG
jgi:glycosyltransferase involved in cell wall biosynthesis